MSKKQGFAGGATQLIEEWLKGTFRLHRIGSYICLAATLTLSLSVGNNVFSGLTPDWIESFILTLFIVFGGVFYLVARYIESNMTTLEAQQTHTRRLIEPKTVKDMIAKALQDIHKAEDLDRVLTNADRDKLERLQHILHEFEARQKEVESTTQEVNVLHG